MPNIKKRWRIITILSTVVVTIAGGGWAYYCWRYPYGWSHSCDKQLMFALLQYAEEHGGAYPAGEATPEASLSLLYPKYANEHVLQGKTVPLDVVRITLENGDRLGPDTCGWHYVEGLRSDDDPKLALCWDKVGLGHFGERLSNGGHYVIFVNPSGIDYIEGSKWEAFLEEQKKLLVERNKTLPLAGASTVGLVASPLANGPFLATLVLVARNEMIANGPLPRWRLP